MASTLGKSRNSHRVVYFLSPRSGGPYKQHALLAQTLGQHGYVAYHCSGVWDWLALHFNQKDIIVSGVPFLWVPNTNNFFLNIRGDYRREYSWRNPLSLLYAHTILYSRTVIVPSEFLKQKLDLQEALVIPNGIKSSANVTHQPKDSKVIRIGTSMSFDFLQKANGILTVIHALQKISEKVPIEFHVFGAGKHLHNITTYVSRESDKLGYNVVFHGYKMNILAHLSTLDIFVYWSVFDNMPNALLDALACGLPVVANNHGAFKEILGDNNLIADSKEEFIEYTYQLATNRAMREKYSKKNRVRSQHFLISTIIQQWMRVLPK